MERHQQFYDHHHPKLRVLRKLWNCAEEVRRKLTDCGRDQNMLVRGADALSVEGVVYAIYCVRSRMLYIGQTLKCAMFRFKEHVRTSLRGEGESLHAAMRRWSWEDFRVFPLEKIPSELYDKGSSKARARAFRLVATPRERFWIDKLHSYRPLGFNIQFSRRHRHRPDRVDNPMKWERQRRQLAVNRVTSPEAAVPQQVFDSESLRWYGSRDWLRRCVFLAKRLAGNTLAQVQWDRYSTRSIACMLRFLECNEDSPGVSAAARAALLSEFRARILVRPRPVKRAGKDMLFFRVTWNNHQLRHIGLKGILCNPEVKGLLPNTVLRAWDDDTFTVAKKLTVPIRHKVMNYRKVEHSSSMVWKDSDCMCRRMFSADFRPRGGCVLTGDLRVVKHDKLRQLLECGPNFRDKTLECNALTAVKEGADDFADRFRGPSLRAEDFGPWKAEVLRRCGEIINKESQPASPMLDTEAREALRSLHRQLVFVATDKAANNFAVICKFFYCHTLRSELAVANGAYELTQTPRDEIIANHARYLGSLRLYQKNKGLPFFYWLPKFHKEPVGSRFIAASSRCTTAMLSTLLSKCLSLVLRTLREKDNKGIIDTGVRRFFVVDTYEEVAGFFARWKRSEIAVMRTGLYTGDFSTMYTTIPHEALFHAIERTTHEAFAHAAQVLNIDLDRICVMNAKSTCQWVRGSRDKHDASGHTLTRNGLNALVRFLVSNTFLACGDSIHRQSIGIPMGTNCAPVLANLFLYYYESSFITRLEEERGREVARMFHMTFRLIDDVLSLDNPEMMQALSLSHDNGGLYPAELTLNQTSKSSTAVEFLGMNIVADQNRLRLSVFDKRKTFPFVVRRYPLMSSLIPRTIPFAVLSGQLHRGYRICTGAEDFLSFAVEVATALIQNGCASGKLKRSFKSFVMEHVHRYHGVRGSWLIRQFSQKLGNK